MFQGSDIIIKFLEEAKYEYCYGSKIINNSIEITEDSYNKIKEDYKRLFK